jgi:hypothetical protein
VNRDPGPGRAAIAAIILGILYAEGGVFRAFSSLIILAILITRPAPGQPSVLQGLIEYINNGLTGAAAPQGVMP